MGKRQRQRAKRERARSASGQARPEDAHLFQDAGPDAPRGKPAAPVREYRDADGNVLTLRGSLTPASRTQYAGILAGGAHREDAWQRAAEYLFERLAVSWVIAGLELDTQKELLARYRIASGDERRFVRDALREHVAEHFPELEAP